ncbi:hypothetical protein [Carnobacterium maltaromaticum]|uniref:hypothetical protein n=1 Tax=Carnobacterium maltaromaticum TaxID=2751 RepID=UPI0012F86D5B|nr:hypothetical protein [Carnobacterium maltaromaticum]
MDEKIVYSALLWFRELLVKQRNRLDERTGYVVYANWLECMKVQRTLDQLNEDIKRIDKQLEQVRKFSRVVKDIGIATGETSDRVTELLQKYSEDKEFEETWM